MKRELILMAAVAGLVAQPATAQDIEQGEQSFRRCLPCHAIGPDAAHRVGPHLNGIMGEPAATRDGFAYSASIIAARDSGLIWTTDTVAELLRDTRTMIPGSKMAFASMRDETMIADIVAYVATFSPDYLPELRGGPGRAPAAPRSP